jgi:hypothetical protein
MYEIENDAIELSVNHQEHNHTDHSNDLCTPICACACCGSLVTISSTQPLSQLKLIVSTSYLFHYKFNYSFEYQEGILHPPTLG